MSNSTLSWKLALIFSLLSVLVSAQSNYFADRMIDFQNGNLPYRENGKWGLVNINNQIIVPALYDSLFHAGKGRCIAQKDQSFFLLDQNFKSYFDESMKEIIPAWKLRHFTGYAGEADFVVLNNYGERSWCAIMPDNSIQCYDHPSKITRQYNYNNLRSTFPVRSNLIDSLIFFSKRPDSSYYACYYKDGTELIFPLHNRDLEFIPPYYIKDYLSKYSREDQEEDEYLGVINLQSRDTILVSGGFLTSSFNHEGENFLIFSDKHGILTVANEKMDTLFTSIYRLEYLNGLLIEEVRTKQETLYNLISFPDMEVIETVIKYVDRDRNFMKIYKKKGKYFYCYNQDGKMFYAGKRNRHISVKSIPHPDRSGLFVVDHRKQVSLLSPNGKILFKGKNKETEISLDYRDGEDNLIVRFYNKKSHDYHYAIYVHEKEILVHTYYEQLHFADKNQFIGCKGEPDVSCDLMNEMGECLIDSSFSQLYFNGNENFKAFTEILPFHTDNSLHYRTYDQNMNFVFDGYFFGDLYVMDDTPHSFMEYEFEQKKAMVGVMDENFQVIIPNEYRAIRFNQQAKYFTVMDQNYQMGYIRLDGTKLFK